MTHFTNDVSDKQRVAFAAPYPGKILPIQLDQIQGDLLCQKDCFLAAVLGTKIDIGFNRRFGAGLFGGEGFILQKLSGDGTAFIHAGGAVIEKRLDNSSIMVDTGCIVAFESTVDYDIKRAGNLKSMLFGGEGLFLATLSGTGRVWLQSLPFSKLADRILYHAPSGGGSSKGQGSVLGSIAGILED